MHSISQNIFSEKGKISEFFNIFRELLVRQYFPALRAVVLIPVMHQPVVTTWTAESGLMRILISDDPAGLVAEIDAEYEE